MRAGCWFAGDTGTPGLRSRYRLARRAHIPISSVTFGTATNAPWADKLRPMVIITIITWIASAISVFALIGLLGREMELERVEETKPATQQRQRAK
jgi:hypothetical protein